MSKIIIKVAVRIKFEIRNYIKIEIEIYSDSIRLGSINLD